MHKIQYGRQVMWHTAKLKATVLDNMIFYHGLKFQFSTFSSFYSRAATKFWVQKCNLANFHWLLRSLIYIWISNPFTIYNKAVFYYIQLNSESDWFSGSVEEDFQRRVTFLHKIQDGRRVTWLTAKMKKTVLENTIFYRVSKFQLSMLSGFRSRCGTKIRRIIIIIIKIIILIKSNMAAKSHDI